MQANQGRQYRLSSSGAGQHSCNPHERVKEKTDADNQDKTQGGSKVACSLVLVDNPIEELDAAISEGGVVNYNQYESQKKLSSEGTQNAKDKEMGESVLACMGERNE
ncbi:hypothetical protein REPUB_Repub11eG0054100 [Reevesia pubescens]